MQHHHIDGKNFGATGFAIAPDGKTAAAAASETPDSEDGGRLIGVVDLSTNTVIYQVEQAYGKPGSPSGIADSACLAQPEDRLLCRYQWHYLQPARWRHAVHRQWWHNDIGVISWQKAWRGPRCRDCAYPDADGRLWNFHEPRRQARGDGVARRPGADKPTTRSPSSTLKKRSQSGARRSRPPDARHRRPQSGLTSLRGCLHARWNTHVVTHFRTNNILSLMWPRLWPGSPPKSSACPW